MKKVFCIAMFALMVVTSGCDNAQKAMETAVHETETSIANSVVEDDTNLVELTTDNSSDEDESSTDIFSSKWYGISNDEIYKSFEEKTPANEISHFGEVSKCIETVKFSHCVWDIYVYLSDGVIGTAVVNDSGSVLEIYGSVFDHINDNYNICVLDRSKDIELFVYPTSNEKNFMVVS